MVDLLVDPRERSRELTLLLACAVWSWFVEVVVIVYSVLGQVEVIKNKSI